jgi:beta-glucanase (GH16 family)
MNAHWGSGYGGPNHHEDMSTISMDPTQWHTYRLTWTATQYIWAVDGAVVKTFTHGSGGREVNSTRPMQLIINLDVGGGWSGATDGSTPFPSSIDVDYIRVYQEI